MTITLTFTMLDQSKESSGFSVTVPGQLGPLNVEQYDQQTPTTIAYALREATRDISHMTIRQAKVSQKDILDGLVYPTNPLAERETKLLVTYTDDTFGKVYNVEIPGYNNVGLIIGSDDVDLANTEIAAWIDAFEAFEGPDGGNRVVAKMTKVGRSL